MNEKCRIVTFKIIVFRGYEIMQSAWWVLRFWSGHSESIFWWPVNTHSEYSSKIFITMYHTTWGLKWNCIINSHLFEYLKSCTKKCVDGNVTLGRLHYRRVLCLLKPWHLVLHTLSTTCVHSVSYFASQTNWGKNIFEYSLVGDNISILFYFLVRSTHDFKAVLKWYQKDNHTRKTIYFQCQMFLK
jgi:hypothetical protein